MARMMRKRLDHTAHFGGPLRRNLFHHDLLSAARIKSTLPR